MFLSKIEIQNFRLWKDAEIELEQQSTVIVGKNNTGKTSFMRLLDIIIKKQFLSFDDYPISDRQDLYNQTIFFLEGKLDFDDFSSTILLPTIKLYVDYSLEKEDDNLGFLSPFIIDTDVSVSEVRIKINYSINKTEEEFRKFFEDIDLSKDDKLERIKNILSKIYPSLLKQNIYALNPKDETKQRKVDSNEFQSLFPIYEIFAERGLDESEQKTASPLQTLMTAVFQPQLDNSLDGVKDKINELQDVCKRVNNETQDSVNKLLEDIVGKSLEFGYPDAEDLQLTAKTNFEIEKQIESSVKLFYHDKNNSEILPDGYNGLGYKNLIKIELVLHDFSQQLKEQVDNSIPLIFIEEPESHMHPQMQQKFIKYIDSFCKEVISKNVQIIITTHSSHIVNSASFEKIRYLQRENDSIKTKNLNTFCQTKDNNKEFLEKYLTLNKCDLFFADKAILIEGTAERLLIPDMIEKLDSEGKLKLTPPRISLKSQYYSLIEVGGAYAHRFIPLMNFLNIPTLIITDIDSVKDKKICLVKEGTDTSNQTIKHWFEKIKEITFSENCLNDIKNMQEENKTDGILHIEYQIEENGLCGRSLEESIKNANRKLYELPDSPSEEDLKYDSSKDGSKTDFAMKLLFDETKNNYKVPKYIENGLIWLNKQ